MGNPVIAPARGIASSEHWGAVCKDCQRRGDEASFKYPDTWVRDVVERGGTRSDRCPVCRKTHVLDARSFAAPYVDIDTIGSVTDPKFPTGPLGGLGPLPTEHVRVEVQSDLGAYDFGLKDANILNLLHELQQKQVAIVVAGTGTGKSTFLPYRLLVPPEGAPLHLAAHGPIVVTEPRRAAAIDTATFVATKLHQSTVGAGSDIGYRVQHEPAYDSACRLLYVTDGSLINWLRDGSFKRFGAIMVDEAHERSKNIDSILGLLREILPRHPRLKLIVASATIDAEFFVEYFGGPGAVFRMDVPAYKQWGYGRPLWPLKEIDDEFLAHLDWQKVGPSEEDLRDLTRRFAELRVVTGPIEPGPRFANWRDRMPEIVADQVLKILDGTEWGDILAFLPGKNTINTAIERIRAGLERRPNGDKVDVFELLRTSPEHIQRQARGEKVDPTRRRVVVSTNIAETSLTIDGITFVIDSGLIHQSEWNVETATKRLPAVAHSQDGVRQRWGRVGRKAPGWVFPLYTEEQFQKVLPEHTPPESTRDDLEQFALMAIAAGVSAAREFVWPAAFERKSETSNPADEASRKIFQRELERATQALVTRGAVDMDGDLTPAGRELQAFSGSMGHAMALILADRMACAIEMATALPLLSDFTIVGKLLIFDRRWEVTRRNQARRIHEATRSGCIDDLDVVLKVYAAWEAQPDPVAWAEEHLVSHEALLKARRARDELLDPLSSGRKSNEVRRVLPELAPRVRAILSRVLTDHTYYRGASGWLPLLPRGERRTWDLDSQAHCVAAERVIAFQRAAARNARVWLANLVQASEWAVDIPGSWVDFALEAAQRLRGSSGMLGTTLDAHLALTQEWHIDRSYIVEVVEEAGGPVLRAIRALGSAPVLGSVTEVIFADAVGEAASSTNDVIDGDLPEEISDGVDETTIVANADSELLDATDIVTTQEAIGDTEASTDLLPQVIEADLESTIVGGDIAALAPAGVVDPTQEAQFVTLEDIEAPDEEDVDPWYSVDASVTARHQTPIEVEDVPVTTPKFRVLDGILPAGESCVRVVGYEGLGEQRLLLVVPERDERLIEDRMPIVFMAGQEVIVRAIEAVSGWGQPFLVATETQTGIEVVLEYTDLTFNRYDQHITQEIPPGSSFPVTLTGFDRTYRTLRASRLDQIHDDLMAALQSEDGTRFICPARLDTSNALGQVQCTLERGDPTTGLVHRYDVWRSILNRGKVLSTQGRRLIAHLSIPKSNGGDRVATLGCDKVPEGLAEMLEGSLVWDEKRKVLSTGPLMSPDLRDLLIALDSNSEWRVGIEQLWHASNMLAVVAVEPASADDVQEYLYQLRDRFSLGRSVTGRIKNIDTRRGVFVELEDGLDGLAYKDKIGPEGVIDPGRYFSVNDQVEVTIEGVNERGQIQLAMPTAAVPGKLDQLRMLFPSDAIVIGTVNKIDSNLGVFVTLEDGISALAHRDKISPHGVINPSEYFSVNEQVEVTIEGVNERGQIQLAMPNAKIPSRLDQLRGRFASGGILIGTVNNVVDTLGVFVTLNDGLAGLAHRDKIGPEGVLRPSRYFAKGQQVEIRVDSVNERGQIQLAIPNAAIPRKTDQFLELFPPGSTVTGTINNVVTNLGVFVTLEGGISALAHQDKIGPHGVIDPLQHFRKGQQVDVRIDGKNDRQQIQLSMPGVSIPPQFEQQQAPYPSGSEATRKVNNVAHLAMFVIIVVLFLLGGVLLLPLFTSTNNDSEASSPSTPIHPTSVSQNPDQRQVCVLYNNKEGFTKVNVREDARLDAAVVASLPNNTRVYIDNSVVARNRDGFRWIKIEIVDTNQEGWVVNEKVLCQ